MTMEISNDDMHDVKALPGVDGFDVYRGLKMGSEMSGIIVVMF